MPYKNHRFPGDIISYPRWHLWSASTHHHEMRKRFKSWAEITGTAWRNPILIYSAFEKTFLVYLVVTNVSHPYARGFWLGAAMDAIVVLYTIVYFGVCGFKQCPA